jgi:hypothetical protein
MTAYPRQQRHIMATGRGREDKEAGPRLAVLRHLARASAWKLVALRGASWPPICASGGTARGVGRLYRRSTSKALNFASIFWASATALSSWSLTLVPQVFFAGMGSPSTRISKPILKWQPGAS